VELEEQGRDNARFSVAPVPYKATCLAVRAADAAGRIVLTVKSAHNMLDKAWLGKSDPYWCVTKGVESPAAAGLRQLAVGS
jgi:hypothetical protein